MWRVIPFCSQDFKNGLKYLRIKVLFNVKILKASVIKNSSEFVSLVEERYPQFIKYMGSKSKIMDFVLSGINRVHTQGAVCDVFAGSCSLAGAIGRQVGFHSNDIQSYSAVIADVYLNSYCYKGMPSADSIIALAEKIVLGNSSYYEARVDYSREFDLIAFNSVENQQKILIEKNFDSEWHLFVKYYSGTWWSAEQCIWIDAIREVAEGFKETPSYSLIISSLMYAMAYTSQGTGHYAQYRDAKTISSMKDILLYRRRKVEDYFKRKYESASIIIGNSPSAYQGRITSLDYKNCLRDFSGGTVYADPPYCFVHYSRFYHAIETLVLYDYPGIQKKSGLYVKGRYREQRHQSPFSIKTQVPNAFEDLFEAVKSSGSNLVLSYSNTGMITVEELQDIAAKTFTKKRIELLFKDHQHMTLGRKDDRHRNVEECLLLVH